MLRGKLYVQIHCYRADEFLTEEAIAQEYGYKIRAFHHALEMYKVADKIAPTDTASPPSPTGGATRTRPGTRFRGTP
jgi:hypothetical protein